MANERWPALALDGSEVLPVANGTYYTSAGMGASQGVHCQVYVEFFSDAAGTIPATPSAGTVSARGSPMGNVWLASSTGETINAADAGPDGDYTPFVFNGRMEQGRAVLNGIAGALTTRVTFWRY